MAPHQAVALLADGLAHDTRPSVRKWCITSLVGYDTDEAVTRQVVAALRDPSAIVRHSAASFIGIRGSRGRPVAAALRPLLDAANQPAPSGGDFEERGRHSAFLMAAAGAIAQTVGAERLILQLKPGQADPPAVQRYLERAATTGDPVIVADANKYMAHLFPSQRPPSASRGGDSERGMRTRCEGCGRSVEKLAVGKGALALSGAEVAGGVGPAEECRECGRVYCAACYPGREPRCVCGADPEAVRVIDGVRFTGSLRLIKARYC
jgi:hypothetical protein